MSLPLPSGLWRLAPFVDHTAPNTSAPVFPATDDGDSSLSDCEPSAPTSLRALAASRDRPRALPSDYVRWPPRADPRSPKPPRPPRAPVASVPSSTPPGALGAIAARAGCVLTRHRLLDLPSTIAWTTRPIAQGLAGSREVLVCLRAIAAQMAHPAAALARRRALAPTLLRREMVSQLSRMNSADAHRREFPATAQGFAEREVWMRLDAGQSQVNAAYMSLLSRLVIEGALDRQDVWRALTQAVTLDSWPSCAVPSYLSVTAATLGERPSPVNTRSGIALDWRYATAFAQLLHTLLPAPRDPDDRSNLDRLGDSFFDGLLGCRQTTDHPPLSLVCRELQRLGAGLRPPRPSRCAFLPCVGESATTREKRFAAALAPDSGETPPPMEQWRLLSHEDIGQALSDALDWDASRRCWGWADLIARPPDDLRWMEEDRSRVRR